VIFHKLEGDLLSVSDWLHEAEHFIFLDALAGQSRGEVVRVSKVPCVHAPSFHQADIGTTMAQLEALELRNPFPKWEIWGITIDPPTSVAMELSPEVKDAALQLQEIVTKRLDDLLGIWKEPQCTSSESL
jgi:Ni,Fe-hydrogenase maturation factor